MSEPVPLRRRPKVAAFDKRDPLTAAIAFAARHTVDGDLGIVTVGGDTYLWRESWWELYAPDALAADLWMWAHACKDHEGNEIKPTRAMIADILAALAAFTHTPVSDGAWWLRPVAGDPAPGDLIVCRNGILNARTRALLQPTRRLFTVNVLPIDADPLAPPPVAWLAFLDQLLGEDREARDLLQEWIALSALTRDTSHQKALLVIGPKRSGKGTVLRILRALAGAANVCSPTFSSLGTPFGLQPLIGKLVALLSDARLSGVEGVRPTSRRSIAQASIAD